MNQFTDVQFMTAKEKSLVLRAWKLFIKSGFNPDKFTNRLYEHLISQCSFIAHYNRGGFFETYFVDPNMTISFLRQFDREQGCVSVEYGMTYWIRDGNDVCSEYYDLNNAMVDTLEPFLKGAYAKLTDAATDNRTSMAERAATAAGGRFVQG